MRFLLCNRAALSSADCFCTPPMGTKLLCDSAVCALLAGRCLVADGSNID